ncbi:MULTISPECIES: hypothetical protein [unclassified Neptuniibacter]|jgi:hypothetical protein|uniref:hypothetical protein n=1 Tax=unclassified Neptuniibacter TaxID=2630693 RepID=UPI0026E14CCE|nr:MULTISPECIES: hypothetical protein [unclassified Neptuniibacter]MDO6514117.1 hypothetical protein [Neptuniibacter sp. 2_MG-2023]MDO6594046.1 hypothetical protein [Neptuniibacter sp. 1_MG-2023]
MKFITTDNKVKCIREIAGKEQQVVDFDIDVNQVAPHVAALLSTHEISELEAWLTARGTLQEHLAEIPNEENIINILPELMHEATQALKELGYIDKQVKKELKLRSSELSTLLKSIDTVDESRPKKTNTVGKSESLKEKLDAVKKQL